MPGIEQRNPLDAMKRPGEPPHATPALAEASRVMNICNSCRYCEGLCAVFPAMEMRRTYPDGDLNYLANLCHNCGACYHDCQFAPPHEYNINVPKTLAEVRRQSYAQYAWPSFLAPMFEKNGLAISLILSLAVAVFIGGFVAWHDPEVMFGVHTGPGAFYKLMPHNTMVAIFGAAFLFGIFAMVMGLIRFWRDRPTEPTPLASVVAKATHEASTLTYLDGGGVGCMNETEHPTDNRRLYHHLTFYGFMLCFAATSVATIYHYVFGWEAPYGYFSLPVILGTIGGIGLVVGPVGLYVAKSKRLPDIADERARGMDVGFLALLFLTGLTGLLLLFLRETSAMGMLLAIHLGVVFGLFVTMPYGKFVHGLYRYAALLRYNQERKTHSM